MATVNYASLKLKVNTETKSFEWGDGENKYKIRFDYTSNKIVWLNTRYCRELNVVYFSTDEKAQEAIKVFHDELMWYYTKYRSRLDEKRTEANTQT